MDGGSRDVGGWLSRRRSDAGLFAVADEVLEVLYCTHDGEYSDVRYRVSNARRV